MKQRLISYTTMGELCQYHVTMLLSVQQEQTIRTLFRSYNWTCLMNVLSCEIVNKLVEKGFGSIFAGNIDEHPEKFKVHLTDSDIDIESNNEQNSSAYELDDPVPGASSQLDEKKQNKGDHFVSQAVKCAVLDELRTQEGFVTDLESYPLDRSVTDYKHLEQTNLKATNRQVDYDDQSSVSSNGKSPLLTRLQDTSQQPLIGHEVLPALNFSVGLKTSEVQTVSCIQSGLEEDSCSVNGKQTGHFPTGEIHSFERRKPRNNHKGKPHSRNVSEQTSEVMQNHRRNKPPVKETKKIAKLELKKNLNEAVGFCCIECGKLFKTKRKLQMHTYASHKHLIPAFQCGVCDATFSARKDLYAHKKQADHNDKVSMLGSYQCDDCGKFIKCYDNFKKHKQFACPIIDEQALKKMRSHPCDECGLTFKSPVHVRRHKTSVHSEAPVVCDVCGTVCKNPYRLNKHKTRHDEKNRKHECKECGKKFFLQYILTQHMRTHTKEKPYKCVICEYKCAVSINLRKHVRNVHKITASAEELKNYSRNELLAMGMEQCRKGMVEDKKLLNRKSSSTCSRYRAPQGITNASASQSIMPRNRYTHLESRQITTEYDTRLFSIPEQRCQMTPNISELNLANRPGPNSIGLPKACLDLTNPTTGLSPEVYHMPFQT